MDISTTATAILAADSSRYGRTVLIQNTGTVDISVGVGAANVAALTATVGVLLRVGADMALTGQEAAGAVSGIVASGTGALRVNII